MRASKSGTPVISHYFTVVGQSFAKTVADGRREGKGMERGRERMREGRERW